MKNMINAAVAGLISAALMVLAKLLLSQQPPLAAYHYPAFSLVGQEGLFKLGLYTAWGAAYGLAYALVLKALIPGGLFGPLILGAVPTLVSAPYWAGTKRHELLFQRCGDLRPARHSTASAPWTKPSAAPTVISASRPHS